MAFKSFMLLLNKKSEKESNTATKLDYLSGMQGTGQKKQKNRSQELRYQENSQTV
jgi:hypothetical protein